jgi:FkbH-like protein
MGDEFVELRRQIDRSVASGEWGLANTTLAGLWRRRPAPATASYVVSRFERLREHLPLITCRVALLRSFTVEPLVPLLRAAAFASGIALDVQPGDFNTYAQEMLDGESPLYQFDPQVVILAVQTRDITPELWDRYADLSPPEVEAAVDRAADTLRDLVRAFRARSRAHLIVHAFDPPLTPADGVLDGQRGSGQVAAIRRLNTRLQQLTGEHAGVYLLDYESLVARFGRARWYDEAKWISARLPLSSDALIELVGEWLRFLHPLVGRVCKVLVTDLDQTIWGGVVGEDGFDGIQIGPEGDGAAYRSLQRALLDLHHRGILLAISSKNNPDEAMEVLERHPGMLLRPHHFAAMRVDWGDKAESLRAIAAELNVGTEALAFLDDNPVERARVRAELPEVTVIDIPDDPIGYARAVRDHPVFERLTLVEEDRQRTRYYALQQQRAALERQVVSVEDFYRSLQMEVDVRPVGARTVARVAQLTQKTNQFNLTTRRYSEQQLADLLSQPGWQLFALRVRDRFGDNGLVGAAFLRCAEGGCEIDSFLLSCRVIGRTVETAFLSVLAASARAAGATSLRGWFLPTKKNAPAGGFYRQHGFQVADETADGTLWSLDLSAALPACPEWIQLHTSAESE